MRKHNLLVQTLLLSCHHCLQCNWLRERIEVLEAPRYDKEKRKQILDRLAWSHMFEAFLATKYTAAKRFGLEVQ